MQHTGGWESACDWSSHAPRLQRAKVRLCGEHMDPIHRSSQKLKARMRLIFPHASPRDSPLWNFHLSLHRFELYFLMTIKTFRKFPFNFAYRRGNFPFFQEYKKKKGRKAGKNIAHRGSRCANAPQMNHNERDRVGRVQVKVLYAHLGLSFVTSHSSTHHPGQGPSAWRMRRDLGGSALPSKGSIGPIVREARIRERERREKLISERTHLGFINIMECAINDWRL